MDNGFTDKQMFQLNRILNIEDAMFNALKKFQALQLEDFEQNFEKVMDVAVKAIPKVAKQFEALAELDSM